MMLNRKINRVIKTALICFPVAIMSALLLAGNLYAAGEVFPKIPVDGQKEVPVNAQIILQSAVGLIQGPDSCFLNGEYIAPASIAGGMAIFKPGQLQFATTYTMLVRDGAFLSKVDNRPLTGGSYSFTTCSPKAKVFDAVVAKDGSGDYTSIRQAVKAAPNNRTEPWLIFVRNGVYEELVRTSTSQPNICLVGEDKERTVLKFSITSYGGHERNNSLFPEAEGQGPVLVANSSDFYLHNITVINSWGYDNQAGPQALALGSYADRFTMFNAILKSYQDTWQTGRDEHRHYAFRSYIEGAVDFIYASGNCVFDSCTIALCRNGSVVVAPSHGGGVKYGYVFRDCNVVSSKPGTARTNNYWGRPWHNRPRTSFINTSLSKDINLSPAGWIDHMGGLPVVFAEYNTIDHMGNPVSLASRNTYYWTGSDRNNPTETCIAQAVLSKEEADALTVRTVLSGTDGWKPDNITTELPAPLLYYSENRLYWTAEPQAICYEVLYNGDFLTFTTETSLTFEGDVSGYRVRAVNMYGTLGQVSDPPFVNGIQTETAGALNVVFDGSRLLASGFCGKARVELYAIDGSKAGQYEIEENVRLDLGSVRFVIAKVTANTGTCVLKAVR
ncbi:MAG: pectinesterase family protein [Bacteroidales bacterium]|jgi:pectin methylesterase-like acyl-CoA thioesterase